MDEMEIRQALRAMELDTSLITVSTYSANVALYPNRQISFTDKHLAYMKARPMLNPKHYLANLRLMIKKRP